MKITELTLLLKEKPGYIQSGAPKIAKKFNVTLGDAKLARKVALQELKDELGSDDPISPVSVKVESKSTSNNYESKFIMSAWNTETGQNMDIDTYCEYYNLPRKDVTSYKFISHTGTPHYNIVFKETVDKVVEEFNFDSIMAKHLEGVTPVVFENKLSLPQAKFTADFDTLTYTDVHIGMDTNSDNNSMYAEVWNKEVIMAAAKEMIKVTLAEQQSSVLVVDELGDFLDGLNGYTTRGGHKLPQNMSDEEAFDCAIEFKLALLHGLAPHYSSLLFNNICNDNHAGSFGYFVNSAVKELAGVLYPEHVKVVNHRQFINHYYVENTCYIITHGKDDKTLKFGFKPFLDSKGIEKIDQYCKQNDIYRNSTKVVFKKGDSHQAVFDMATSDDFFYFNYPALSPSSQWVQNNFKKGRRGFVLESSRDTDITIKMKFK